MIKLLHITTVAISLLLFISRGSWIYLFKRSITSRWLKIAPHLNDTILLVSGITLAIRYQQYPFVHHWLTVKIICLVLYILLGMVAMKWRYQQKQGFIAWLVAIVIFLFMISVALTLNPLGIISLLL